MIDNDLRIQHDAIRHFLDGAYMAESLENSEAIARQYCAALLRQLDAAERAMSIMAGQVARADADLATVTAERDAALAKVDDLRKKLDKAMDIIERYAKLTEAVSTR